MSRRCHTFKAFPLYAVLVAATLSGCDAGTRSTPAPSSGTGLRPSVTASPILSGDLPLEAVDAPWRSAGSRPVHGYGGDNQVGVDYVARMTTSLREVEVLRRSDMTAVMTHKAQDAEYETVFTAIAGHHLVVADGDVEGDKRRAQAYIYDITTRRRVEIGDIPGAPRISVFGAQAHVTDDGRYFYSATQSADGRPQCVAAVDLHSMTGKMIHCAKKGTADIAGLYIQGGGNIVTWLYAEGGNLGNCKTGYTLSNGKVTALGEPQSCDALGTATAGGWYVSSRSTLGLVPDPPLVATDGQEEIDLGKVDGLVLLPCAGYVYWRLQYIPDIYKPDDYIFQIRRWKPGLTAVEVVLSEPRPSDPRDLADFAPPRCNHGILTVPITRGDYQDALGKHEWTRELKYLDHKTK